MRIFLILAAIPFVVAPTREIPRFNQIDNSLFEVKSIRPDHNENFFSDDLDTTEIIWDSRLQSIQDKIDEKLVLPPSLVRSFILVAENRIPQTRSIELNGQDPDVLDDMFRIQYHRVKSSIPPLYLYKPRNRGAKLRKATQFLNKYSATHESSVQVLIGDEGASGVGSLVEKYAKATKRQLVRPGESQSVLDLLDQIARQSFSGKRPVVLVDQLNLASEHKLNLVLCLLKNRALLGDASLVIGLGSHHYWSYEKTKPPIQSLGEAFVATNAQDSRGHALAAIVSLADSVHLVRMPQSIKYYQAIVSMLVAKNLKRSKNVQLKNQKKIIKLLAASAFDLQQTLDHSMVNLLEMVIDDPSLDNTRIKNYVSTCRGAFNNDVGASLTNFIAASQAYGKGMISRNLKN